MGMHPALKIFSPLEVRNKANTYSTHTSFPHPIPEGIEG
jgi:hypothetical protein